MQNLNLVNWTPTVGDPTFIGWFTTVAYLITTLFAARIYLTADNFFTPSTLRKQKDFWLLMAFILLFLGVNKQLDLQTLLIAISRYYAKQKGWYQNRHAIQQDFIIGIIIFSIMIFSIFALSMKSILTKNRHAILGAIFLVIFIILRAATFYHISFLSNIKNLNWMLELSGIFLIAYSAFFVKSS